MTADPRLLVPLAKLPGLDPVGLPVRGRGMDSTTDPLGWAVGPTLTQTQTGRNGRLVARPSAESDGIAFGNWEWDDTLYLDLSDAATRDRCLRWLAGRVGLEVGCGAPRWAPWPDQMASWELDSTITWDPMAPVEGREGKAFRGCPALVDLDPTDDTRLPDGSRLVDALALAAVLRQGGTP